MRLDLRVNLYVRSTLHVVYGRKVSASELRYVRARAAAEFEGSDDAKRLKSQSILCATLQHIKRGIYLARSTERARRPPARREK